MTRPLRLGICAWLAVTILVAACAHAPGASGGPGTAAEAARQALAQQARFAGIKPLDQGQIGQASWYQVAPSGDGWEVLIRIGWGDCPAGCINEHRWTYAVGPDGRAELVHEEGDALPDTTGVKGAVTAGPTCPVVRDPPDPACAERPVAGAVLVFNTPAGVEAARALSGKDGTFMVELAPGSYRLTAQPVDGLMRTPAPMDIEVKAGQPMADLKLSYDTGIR
ncbi:MAG: carboxypeptidase-like regulatory domain-containing protein [Chloroflexota bacterium]|nr:carboxypeptidase-like regulatory domain-containing protein [Chloroflexota bacterium]